MRVVLNNFSALFALVLVFVVGAYSYGTTEQAAKSRMFAQMLVDAFEMNGTAIISSSRHGLIQDWSPVAEDIFGYTASEIVGLPVETLIADGNRERHSSKFNHAMGNEGGKFWVQGITCEGRHKSGEGLWLNIKTWVANDKAIAVITPAERIRQLAP